jgi:ubiquinone/menaquinone biosynthesis C-methylase UbiE
MIIGGLIWRWAGWPCPSWLVPLLENPYVETVAASSVLLDRAGLRAGMHVLDAGCGPGRLTIPAAERVGPTGRVVALDVQPKMIAKLRARIERVGLDNIDLVVASLGEVRLPHSQFDRALLVTVLGEVHDKVSALTEIFHALKPNGVLCVTEVIPDPHYQRIAHVRNLASKVGFREGQLFRGLLSYTLNLIKEENSPGYGP